MSEHDITPADRFSPRAGRRVRVVREAPFTGLELLAYAMILTMVCGPLALGAFGL